MSVLVRQRRGREGWWVRATANGKTRWKKCESQEHAEQLAKDAQTALKRKNLIPRNRLPLPTDELLQEWLRIHGRTLKRSSRVLAEGVVRNHLEPYFGAKDLRALSHTVLLEFAEVLRGQGKGLDVVKNCIWVLRRVCSIAVADGRLDRNPCAEVGRSIKRIRNAEASETKTRSAWTAGELRLILDACAERTPRYLPFLTAAVHTGGRRSELLGIRWEEIDFDRAEIRIRRAIVRGESGTGKTGPRAVPLSPELAGVLLDLLAAQGGKALGYVFRGATGKPIEAKRVDVAWRKLIALAVERGVRAGTFHELRHTFASLGLAAGLDPVYLAAVLGHRVDTMLAHYAHAIPRAKAPLGFLAGVGHSGAVTFCDRETDAKEETDATPRKEWRAQHDSNMRPSGPQPDALSN